MLLRGPARPRQFMKLTAFRCKIRSSLQYSFSVPGRTKCSSGLNLNEMIMWFNTDVFADPWNGNCFMAGGGGYFPVMAYRNSCFWLNVYKKHRNLQTRRDNRAKGTLVHWENWGGGRGGAHVPSMPSRFLRLFIWECLWDTKIRDSHKHARTSIYKRAYETPK